jgi:hypothetical protein
MMSFSASGFERVAACPASAVLPQHRNASAYADTGNSGHEVLCRFVLARRTAAAFEAPIEWQGLCDAIADFADKLHPELAMAINVATLDARILGSNIGRDYQLRELEVAGTADLVGATETHAIVIDAKTGWGEVTHPTRNKQLRLLALMACRVFGRDAARVAILRCHESDDGPRWEWAELDAMDLDETAFDLDRTYRAVSLVAARVQAGRLPDVTEGSWCKYCPAKVTCPAKVGLALQVAEGRVLDGPVLMPLTPERAGVVWRRLGVAKQLVTQLEAAVRVCLDEYGDIPLPDGSSLRKILVDGKEKLDGDAVWEVLVELAGREVADRCVTRHATKKRLGEVLRHDFGRGGAAKEREVLAHVRERGGATRGKEIRLVEVEGGR